MQDQAHNIQVKRVLSPASVADDTAQVGQIIDRLGYDSLTYVIATGSIGDADADMIGTEAAAGFQFDDDNEVRKLGYIGNKRYTRLTITPTGNGSAALLGAVAVLGNPHVRPVVQAAA